jgi:hypothetical protein
MADTNSRYFSQASRSGMRRSLALAAMLLALVLAGCQRTPSADPSAPAAQAAAQSPSTKASQDAPAMPDAAQIKPASDAPPSPSSVLYMIYQVDGDGATSYPIENGSVASYWYGHEFELGGKHYFTGFAYDTPEKYGKSDEESYPDPDAHVTLTQATFELANPGSDKAWAFQGAERYVGEFGGYEKADEVDAKRKAQSYPTPDGKKLVLAVPTTSFESGVTTSGFATFVFDPGERVKSDDKHWTYVGTVVTGEDNAAACDDGEVMPCESSSGTLSFEAGKDGGMPVLNVARSGTTIESAGKTRALGAADAATYTYDAAKKQYATK